MRNVVKFFKLQYKLGKIDESFLNTKIGKQKPTNAEKDAKDLISKLTFEEKAEIMATK